MLFAEVVLALAMVGIVGWFLNTQTAIDRPVRSLLNVVLMLIVVGVSLWIIDTYVPMAAGIRAILNFVVFVATCVGVLQGLGLWTGFVKFWSDVRENIMTHHAPRL
ncbi:MAG TPA: Thivi_2564 family membrane protein [Bryobacteraceae bacterium]|jgi:undecaprenyl pyrophosphate phosphatase UppP|nr:Thivi_2564 family membrane protein [Bryobacteraceae bacterium]